MVQEKLKKKKNTHTRLEGSLTQTPAFGSRSVITRRNLGQVTQPFLDSVDSPLRWRRPSCLTPWRNGEEGNSSSCLSRAGSRDRHPTRLACRPVSVARTCSPLRAFAPAAPPPASAARVGSVRPSGLTELLPESLP